MHVWTCLSQEYLVQLKKLQTTMISHELESRLGPSVPDSQRADVPWWPSRLEYILKTCPNSSRPKNILLHNPDWSNSFWQTRYFPILSLINADGMEYKEEEGWPGLSDEKYKIGIEENMAHKVWNWGHQPNRGWVKYQIVLMCAVLSTSSGFFSRSATLN